MSGGSRGVVARVAISVSLLGAAACNPAAGAGSSRSAPAFEPTAEPSDPSTTRPPSTPAPATAPPTTPSPTEPATSRPATSSTAASSTTTTSTTTSTTTTTTTTTLPPLDVFDVNCVVQVTPGDSLGLIAENVDDELVDAATLRGENGLASTIIHAGELLDVCVDNGIDDITGDPRPERNPAIVAAETGGAVQAQQAKLNALFAGLGTPSLDVDGDSGPLTRQLLCAARVALGLPVSIADMTPGSDEEAVLMAAESIPVPYNEAVLADRWALIDRTCQVMFVGRGTEAVTFVFPTSTGEEGHETDLQTRAPAFRYDPALDNGGWHNSSIYPVPADDPLNGNMYRPIYFNAGEAIHGANYVPTFPRSKGCARLRVEHQDQLVAWLGLADAGGPVWQTGRIDLAVTVQGDYVG